MSFLSRRGPRSEEPAALPYDPRSPEGLAARWVRWVAAAGPVKDPVDDETGQYAGENQPDDVFFLAGSYGKRMERRCVVPVGRDLFVPVFTWWEWPAETAPKSVLEHFSASLVVDGAPVQPDAITTPVPFIVAGARLNGVTQRKKPVPVTVQGFWKLVPAPTPGPHDLRVVARGGNDFTVDVTYRLTVSDDIPAYTYPTGP
jgi:hypothetical protein